MHVSWWTVLCELNAYDEEKRDLPETLVRRLKDLKMDMTEGNVTDETALKTWVNKMMHNSNEVWVQLDFTEQTKRVFTHDGGDLDIKWRQSQTKPYDW